MESRAWGCTTRVIPGCGDPSPAHSDVISLQVIRTPLRFGAPALHHVVTALDVTGAVVQAPPAALRLGHPAFHFAATALQAEVNRITRRRSTVAPDRRAVAGECIVGTSHRATVIGGAASVQLTVAVWQMTSRRVAGHRGGVARHRRVIARHRSSIPRDRSRVARHWRSAAKSSARRRT